METLGSLVRKTFKQHANRLALSYKKRTLTYEELQTRTLRLANAILSQGLKKGDRLAILMKNRLEHIELDLAIALTGLIKVPINYRLHRKEIEYIVTNSGAKLIIGEENLIDPLKLAIPYKMIGKDYENWISEHSSVNPEIEVKEDDTFAIMYTSGTTGNPKGVMLSHRNMIAGALSLIMACEITYGDVIGHVAPLTHGSNFLSQCALFFGLKQVIFDKFEPKDFIDDLEKERVTTIFLVPTMVNLMIHDPNFDANKLSSLKSINMAGAPMAAEKIKHALDLLGPKLIETYGQVEAPMTISMMPRHELQNRLDSCGAIGPFVDVKIVDEQGSEVKVGEIGEVTCKGSLVMQGYWNNPKATEETLKAGWLYTGDLGWLDENGYLHLVDRKKDVIISGGVNIYPREVEEVLNLHPSVKETCVFGIPDEKWGESVAAHVILKDGETISDEDLIQLCKEHLASFKKPKEIKIVDQLPKSSYGKILKKEIRKEYGGQYQ